MLESLESETPNIKDLSVEEQKTALPSVDLNKDLDWPSIIEHIRLMMVEDESPSLVDRIADSLINIALAMPEKLQEMDFLSEALDKIKEQLIKELTADDFNQIWPDCLEMAYCLKLISPERLPTKILKDRRVNFDLNITDNNIGVNSFGLSRIMFNYRMLFGENNLLKKYRDDSLTLVNNSKDNVFNFSYLARNHRITFSGGDRSPENDIIISLDEWRKLYSVYQERTDHRLNPVGIMIGYCLKVIRAKEVKVTNNGVELIGDRFEEDLNEQSELPLPAQRSF